MEGILMPVNEVDEAEFSKKDTTAKEDKK